MTLVVQDDTGTVVGANGYIDEAYLVAFQADRGVTVTATSPEQQAAIVRATDYMDGRFGRRFVGCKTTLEQTTAWPRVDAVNRDGFDVSNVLPQDLKEACAEYSNIAITNPELLKNIDQSITEQLLILERKKVGPLEKEFRYSEGVARKLPSYPTADNLIRNLLKMSSSAVYR